MKPEEMIQLLTEELACCRFDQVACVAAGLPKLESFTGSRGEDLFRVSELPTTVDISAQLPGPTILIEPPDEVFDPLFRFYVVSAEQRGTAEVISAEHPEAGVMRIDLRPIAAMAWKTDPDQPAVGVQIKRLFPPAPGFPPSSDDPDGTLWDAFESAWLIVTGGA